MAEFTDVVYEYPRPVKVRSIYQAQELPFLARAYRYAYDYRRLSLPSLFRINRKILPSTVRWLFRSGLGKRQGRFTIKTQRGIRHCEMNINNSQFHSIYFRRFQSGYEPEVCALLDVLIEQEQIQTFYDIGANWGHLSGYVASHPLFRGKIHAFEPQKAAFADLIKLVQQAELAEWIECHPIALSDTEGLGDIQLPDGFHSGLGQLYPGGGKVTVRTLDNLGLPLPDLIKLDVESHEQNVLWGAIQILTRHKPYLIFENLPTDRSSVINDLNLLKYNCFEIKAHPLPAGSEYRTLTLTPVNSSATGSYKRNIFACSNNAPSILRDLISAKVI